jgi:hypothetical protein
MELLRSISVSWEHEQESRQMCEKLLLRLLGLDEAHPYTLEQSHRSLPFSVVVANTTLEDEGLCSYRSAKTVRSIAYYKLL